MLSMSGSSFWQLLQSLSRYIFHDTFIINEISIHVKHVVCQDRCIELNVPNETPAHQDTTP